MLPWAATLHATTGARPPLPACLPPAKLMVLALQPHLTARLSRYLLKLAMLDDWRGKADVPRHCKLMLFRSDLSLL